MKFWVRILINAVLFIALAGFLKDSFYVASPWIALVASVVLSLLNALVKPILVVLSLPITIVTLGLFSIVINGAMLQLTSMLIGNDFHFSSFGTALLVAILMSVCNAVISDYVGHEHRNG
ncbi:membrane protein [Secundilactobacillus pentosiphilus]|uniref:Membrane protein n=1 Tax=Secundilactobacillus pentosiphilus TaxID=1714682 RepID=A0A1Z5IN77_9LACO|nr:phage holin family protein [Secundilactobacillus pentosiphilus]GAX03203.1 membrane protein [Secundilactobacillus pentosiphilus]GAX06789.1 membrane protein [Secundilactobacillus pentosiphilus]